MDLMMRLNGGQAFKAISDEFQAREKSLGQEGLPLADFVEIMMKGLPKAKSPKEAYDTISGLIDLFNDIDINGDGTLELSEFTSYCVDAGMVATRVKVAPLKYQYVKNKEFVDRTTQGSGIEKIKWCPEFKRAIVVETKANSVKIYSHEFKLLNEVFATSLHVPTDQVGLCMAPDDAHFSRQSATSDLDLLVQDAEFVTAHKLLAVALSNFTLAFYDVDHYANAMETQTTVTQTMLRWCDGANVLATSGNNHVVSLWRVSADKVSLVKQLLDHRDVVMDVLPIPQYDVVLTCDIKRFISMWDIQDFRSRGHLVGHTHGVRQMVFSAMNDMLLTAGFEFDAYGWDVSSKQIVMTLSGHRAPLVGVQLARFHTERAVTADVDGNFKVWNIHRLNGSTAQLLESVSNVTRFCPRTFVTMSPRRDIVAGSSVLHIFESIKIQKHDEIPLRAFYHHGSNLFFGVTETCVNLWDGGTGVLLEEFTGLTTSQFLLCCQDSLHRKLILATEDGQVEVYNCTNLARVRKSSGSIGRIAAIQYDSANKLIIACTFPSSSGKRSEFGSGGIYVFDDSTIGECALLRSLTNLNIETSSFSYNASLIATVASEAVIQLWDFETLQLQSVVSHPGSLFHVVQFLDPYPVLVAADNAGNVVFFTTTPQMARPDGGALHCFTNAHVAAASDEVNEEFSVVTTINCQFDDETQVHMLVTGDERGVISIWNLNDMIARLKLAPIPDEKLKCLRRGYHSRSKFARVFDQDPVVSFSGEARCVDDTSRRNTTGRRSVRQTLSSRQSPTGSARKPPTPRQPCDVHRMHSWVAHTDAIHSIQVCQHPNILLSSAFDAVIWVWDWKGTCLGSLANFENNLMAPAWKFVKENEKRERERREVVEELMKKMDLSPEERKVADTQRRKSRRAVGLVNPILEGLMEDNPRALHPAEHKGRNRKRVDPVAAHENGRHLSLMQVGPLIAQRRSTRQLNDEPSCDSDTFEIDKKDKAKADLKSTAQSLTSRLEVLQNHENLVQTTKHLYVNYMGIQDDRRKKASVVRSGKLRDVDVNPSPFLCEKLGAADVITMNHSVFTHRPCTAPALKSTNLPPCSSSPKHHKSKQSVANLMDPSSRRASRKSMSALHLDDHHGHDIAPSASAGKLQKINDIIVLAASSIENGSAADDADTAGPACNQERAELKQRILLTKSKHDQLVAEAEQPKGAKTSLRTTQQKLEKDKRAKRYLAQKKRQTTAKIGSILRHTSFMLTGHTPGAYESAKGDGANHRFGIYSIKEVMVIIRLFWSLDIDCSGTVCESELMGCQEYFEKLGYTDMATIFRSIDSDGSGEVNLAELLKICFMYASATDIKDMLTLEKLGRAPSILASDAPLTPQQLADMRDIFHVFDRDRSGTISFDEVLEALHCKQDNIYEPPALSVDEIRTMYQAEDRNGNKELDFDEFVSLLQGLYSHSGKPGRN